MLSKATKLADKKAAEATKPKSVSFEIAGADVKEESTDDEEKPSKEELEELELIGQRKERNNKLLSLRVKPSAMDRERERTFKRIANKGLVQLFNAVRSQQRDLVDKLDAAGPLDHRRDAVLNNINKRQFLDVLMGGSRAKSENVDNAVKDESIKDEEDDVPGRASQWSVLRWVASSSSMRFWMFAYGNMAFCFVGVICRDDFMTNRKLSTHWNNDDDDDEDDEQRPATDDDDDDDME